MLKRHALIWVITLACSLVFVPGETFAGPPHDPNDPTDDPIPIDIQEIPGDSQTVVIHEELIARCQDYTIKETFNVFFSVLGAELPVTYMSKECRCDNGVNYWGSCRNLSMYTRAF